MLGVIHNRRSQLGGRGVKGKRTRADIGGGGQAWVDVHKKNLKKVSKKT